MRGTIRPAPWDSDVFGFPCFELSGPDEDALAHAARTPGHYTVKVDPLADKALLHRYGFYYVDTLIRPVCDDPGRLVTHRHPDCHISSRVSREELIAMCRNSFIYGRFHRDFNISPEDADRRYVRWLTQLCREGNVYGLMHGQRLAGFIACRGGALLLHAMGTEFRGRGLAKYFWFAVCERLFASGHAPLHSSVSAANLAVLNLYRSLGFRFDHAVDVYHRLSS